MTAQAVLLATTILYRERFADTPYTEHPFPSDVETVMAADELAEFAGRSEDESWDRPHSASATNRRYLEKALIHEHYSVLEHASATFWITGVSRSLTAELIRHSGLAYSRLSERTDQSDADFVVPPVYRTSKEAIEAVGDIFDDSRDAYRFLVARGIANGLSVREARDAARCVLPGCTETTILVTGDMRTWREVIDRYNVPAADAEIRELAQSLLRQLAEIAPNSFQDMVPRGPTHTVLTDEVWNAANPPISVAPLSLVNERVV